MAGQKVNNIFDSKTVGNIIRMFATQCSVPAQVYFETAAPALLDAFIGYERPDPKAIYDKAFGHSFIHDARGVARKMGLLSKNPNASKVARFASDFLTFSDLIPFYIFMIDLAAEGVFNWSSDVLEVAGCGPPMKGQGGGGYAPFGASFDGGRWGTFDFWFDGPMGPAGPPGVVLQPGQNCMIAVQATATDLGGIPVGYDARISVSDTGATLDAATSEPKSGGGYNRNATWAQYHHGSSASGATIVEWQCTYDGTLPDHELFPGDGSAFVAKW